MSLEVEGVRHTATVSTVRMSASTWDEALSSLTLFVEELAPSRYFLSIDSVKTLSAGRQSRPGFVISVSSEKAHRGSRESVVADVVDGLRGLFVHSDTLTG